MLISHSEEDLPVGNGMTSTQSKTLLKKQSAKLDVLSFGCLLPAAWRVWRKSQGEIPCFVGRLTSFRAIAIPIGNAILVNGLLKQIPRHTQSVSAQDVIRAGSTNLRTLTSDMSTLLSLQTGYAEAVVATIYLALAAGCASFPFAVFMEWRSVKPGAGPHEKDKKDVETATTVKPVIKG